MSILIYSYLLYSVTCTEVTCLVDTFFLEKNSEWCWENQTLNLGALFPTVETCCQHEHYFCFEFIIVWLLYLDVNLKIAFSISTAMEGMIALPKKKEKDDLDDLLKPQSGKKGKQGTKGAKLSANTPAVSKVDDKGDNSKDPTSVEPPKVFSQFQWAVRCAVRHVLSLFAVGRRCSYTRLGGRNGEYAELLGGRKRYPWWIFPQRFSCIHHSSKHIEAQTNATEDYSNWRKGGG